MTDQDNKLLRLLPKVLRAREYNLYTEDGKKLKDLWLDGGKAILGHKPPRVLGELKNAAERGLFSPLPHPMERRFLKALGELFPGRGFRLYRDSLSMSRALEEAGYSVRPMSGPAFLGNEQQQREENKVYFWRPFTEQPGSPSEASSGAFSASVFIPILPLPLGPDILVLHKDAEAYFPPGDLIPPVILAPAGRALYDLIKVLGKPLPKYPRLEKALRKSIWQRQGIYLNTEPGTGKEKYAEIFRFFLEGGFLIPPFMHEPAILPPSLTQGEEAKLSELLKRTGF